MFLLPTAHLDGDGTGDPAVHCEQLVLMARSAADARRLARLFRVLSDPDQRDRLLELAERVEAESAAGRARRLLTRPFAPTPRAAPMSSDRLLRDLPSPEVAAERTRVQGILAVVIDDLILRVGGVTHPVAAELMRAFALEFASVRKAVREGATAEEFAAARPLPFAQEVSDGDDRSRARVGDAQQR